MLAQRRMSAHGGSGDVQRHGCDALALLAHNNAGNQAAGHEALTPGNQAAGQVADAAAVSAMVARTSIAGISRIEQAAAGGGGMLLRGGGGSSQRRSQSSFAVLPRVVVPLPFAQGAVTHGVAFDWFRKVRPRAPHSLTHSYTHTHTHTHVRPPPTHV